MRVVFVLFKRPNQKGKRGFFLYVIPFHSFNTHIHSPPHSRTRHQVIHREKKKSVLISPPFPVQSLFLVSNFFISSPFFFYYPAPVRSSSHIFFSHIHPYKSYTWQGRQIERCRHCGVRSFTHFGGALNVHYSDIHVHTHVYTTQRLPVQLASLALLFKKR